MSALPNQHPNHLSTRCDVVAMSRRPHIKAPVENGTLLTPIPLWSYTGAHTCGQASEKGFIDEYRSSFPLIVSCAHGNLMQVVLARLLISTATGSELRSISNSCERSAISSWWPPSLPSSLSLSIGVRGRSMRSQCKVSSTCSSFFQPTIPL